MLVNMPIINTKISSEAKSNDEDETSLRNILKRKYPLPEENTTTINSCSSITNSTDFQQTSANYQLNKTKFNSIMSHNVQTTPLEENAGEQANEYLILNDNSLINDFLNYDANLISLTNATATSASDVLSVDILSPNEQTSYIPCTTASFLSTNVQYIENSDNWQNTSSDLLELDHRYNSNIQTSLDTVTTSNCLTKSDNLHMELLAGSSRQICTATKHRFNRSIQSRSQQVVLNQPFKYLTPVRHQRNISVSSSLSSSSSLSTSLSSSNKMLPHYNEVPVIPSMPYDSDSEDKSLAWLLNFKFDDFSQLGSTRIQNEQNGRTSSTTTMTTMTITTKSNNSYRQNNIIPHTTIRSQIPLKASSGDCLLRTKNQLVSSNKSYVRSIQLEKAVNSILEQNIDKLPNEEQQDYQQFTTQSQQPIRKKNSKVGRKFAELVVELTTTDNELLCNDTPVSATDSLMSEEILRMRPKKPPFTYTELIEYALEDKGELTVSEIYQWISDRFSYYKSNDDRWKNSVRHNLSINPHFRKGMKAPQGAGHLWSISSGDSAENILAWEHKKQRLDLYFKMEVLNRERKMGSTYSSDYEFDQMTMPSLAQSQQTQQQTPLEQQYFQKSTEVCKTSNEDGSMYETFFDLTNHRDNLPSTNIGDTETMANLNIKHEKLQKNENQEFINNDNDEKHFIEFDEKITHCGTNEEQKNDIELTTSTFPFQQQEQKKHQLYSPYHQSHLVSNNEKNVDEALKEMTKVVSISYKDLLSPESLSQVSGEFLNGIHREIEVQSMEHITVSSYENVLLENGNYLETLNSHALDIVNNPDLRYNLPMTVSEVTNNLIQKNCNENQSTTNMISDVTAEDIKQSLYRTDAEIDVMDPDFQISTSPPSVIVNKNTYKNSDISNQNIKREISKDFDIKKEVHNDNNINSDSKVVSEVNTNTMLFNDEFNLNYFDISTSSASSSAAVTSVMLSTTQSTNTAAESTS